MRLIRCAGLDPRKPRSIADQRRHRAHVPSVLRGLPLFMTLFAFVGIAVTSATMVIYGEAIPDPTVLLGRLGGGLAVVVSLAVGVAPNVPGFLQTAGWVDSLPEIFTSLYTYAWFGGFVLAGVVYWGLAWASGVAGIEPRPSDRDADP